MVMAYLEAKLVELENGVRLLKNASAILFIIVTTDERGQTIYHSLKKVEAMVEDLNDKRLTNLYRKLFEGFLTGTPHQQIRPDDYFAFLQRLGTLLNDVTAQANEADLALREAIGKKSAIVTWGGKDYLPYGQL